MIIILIIRSVSCIISSYYFLILVMRNPQHEISLEQVSSQISEFTCEICTEPMPNWIRKFKNGNRCSHPFCRECVIKYIQVQLNDNNVAQIPCPALNCDHTLDPVGCAPVVGPLLFVRWCDVLCESAISGFDKSYCPDRNCNVLIVNECAGRVKEAKCPSCKKLFCFQCKGVWHGGRPCQESLDLNDVVLGDFRRCPQCGLAIELVDGCSTVKCRCGMSFCYDCGRQVSRHACGCRASNARLLRQMTLGMWLVCLATILFALFAFSVIFLGIIRFGVFVFHRLYSPGK